MSSSAGRRALWLLALALLGLLQTTWFLSSVPLPLKIGIAGLLAIAVVRASWAFLIWAGLAPLTTSIAELAGAPMLGAQLLEAMTAAVLTGFIVRHTTFAPSRLAWPALLMSVVALASGLSELPARLIAATEHHVTYHEIARLLFYHSVDRVQALEPWYFALIIAQGAALAWTAEQMTRRDPELAPRVVWCALVGHAGVAVLNI